MSAPAKSGRTVPGCMGTKKQYTDEVEAAIAERGAP